MNVFTAPGKAMVGERPKPFGEALGFDPITSTLIFGEYDAVLVDAMTTVAEAEALADWIALHNRNLETIYITHAHFDHFYGLSILLDRFPGARAIATPKTVNAMQMSFTPPVERLARRMFPGQVATKLVAPEPYEHDTFTLEGHELRIIEQGRTDSPDSTSLYVPSIGLIVAGDVVYNQCRMYVGDTTPESRKNWIADLDRLAALNPTIVVAGHKKPGAPDSPSAIQDTKRYLEDFDRRAENRDVRPGAVRSDDGAIPGLGGQSVVVDVRIPPRLARTRWRSLSRAREPAGTCRSPKGPAIGRSGGRRCPGRTRCSHRDAVKGEAQTGQVERLQRLILWPQFTGAEWELPVDVVPGERFLIGWKMASRQVDAGPPDAVARLLVTVCVAALI